MTKKLVLDYSALYSESLSKWIEENCSFPNSMVDRITPMTTQADIDELKQDWGIVDGWPVVAEDFTQWVVEDNFIQGRPEWEAAGAMFVPDVIPYEKMKLRLLNSSHQALAYVSYIAGFRKVDKVTRDPVFNKFIRGYLDEITSTIPDVPGVDLTEYKKKLVERYSNRLLSDQVARLCEDASKRLNVSMAACVDHKLRENAPREELQYCAMSMAGWIRYLDGKDENGDVIDFKDNMAA
jgi:mannitol 2-dehydrogenase